MKTRHLPALDGMRGMAILLVIVYHTFAHSPQSSIVDKLVLHIASVGWLGVDLFFVLSGFLITGILLDAKGSSNFMRAFYGRRILRIVPAYVVFVLFCIWLSTSVGVATPEAAQQMKMYQWWYWGYVLNLLIAIRGWSAAAVGSHLWSLSVEEQFYLLWPAVVLFLSVRSLQRVAVGCFVGAELMRIVFLILKLRPETNYVLLPSRMDTLAAGAFLACAFRTPALWTKVLKWKTLAAGVAMLALISVIASQRSLDFHRPLVQLVAFPSLAVLSGLAVIAATHGPRWMAHPLLRFFGKFSYAMYLWHESVIALLLPMVVALRLPSPAGINLPYFVVILTAVLLSTTGIALASWILVERPFLSLKRFLSYSGESLRTA